VTIDVLKKNFLSYSFVKCKIAWCPFEVCGFDYRTMGSTVDTRCCMEMDRTASHSLINSSYVLTITIILTMPNFDVINLFHYLKLVSLSHTTVVSEFLQRRLERVLPFEKYCHVGVRYNFKRKHRPHLQLLTRRRHVSQNQC
jgi:hypothetical protein